LTRPIVAWSANLSVGTERGKLKAQETRDEQAPKFNAKGPNAGAHDEFEIWHLGLPVVCRLFLEIWAFIVAARKIGRP